MSARESACPNRTCEAWREWDVDYTGHLYVARYAPCVCSGSAALVPAYFGRPLEGACLDCGAPCKDNAKRCLACGGAANGKLRDYANHRHRRPDLNEMTGTCCECGATCKCSAQRCAPCARVRDRAKAVEYAQKYQARKRSEVA